MLITHLRSLSRHNQAMNEKVYTAALRLPPEEVVADRGAFFGSIQGTLNHMMVTDICWLKRFGGHPSSFSALEPLDNTPWPDWYDTPLYDSLEALYQARQNLDQMIVNWTEELKDADLEHVLSYQNMRKKPFQKPFFHLALHLFHHQIHHRGQVSTLLSQAGEHIDGTGVLPYVENDWP